MNDDLLPIFRQLNLVFQDVFDDDRVEVNTTTTAEDIDGWNSLAHIRLMVSIEKAFKLRFSAAEISSLKNVGDMALLIARKQAGG
jgi:acyl carrier protein